MNLNPHTSAVYDVTATQGKHLMANTEQLISALNRFYELGMAYMETHDVKALELYFPSQGDFFVSPYIIDGKGEFVYLPEFETLNLNFDDGKRFGHDDLPYEVDEHSRQDAFFNARSEVLSTIFCAWIFEAVWNSDLMKFPKNVIFVHTPDYDNITELKAGEVYYNLDFLDEGRN